MSFWKDLGKAALSGLAGGVGPGLFSLGSSLLTNKGAQRRQMVADQQNINFWKMQNAYNTPKEQMKRLQDAGLNPNLIYGSGSANTGVAGSIAPSKPAPYNIKNPIPLQAALLTAQIRNTEAQTAKTNADADQIRQLTGGKVTNLELRNQISAVKAEIQNRSKNDQIQIIQNSRLQSEFNNKIKQADAEAATQGYVKGNYIYTIFTQLGIADNSEFSKTMRKALIGGLIGSQLFGNLTSGIKNLIPKKGNVSNPTFNRAQELNIIKN